MTCDRIRELAAGYVLGALEPAEMAAVRDHLDRCRKPHPELAELGGVLPYLAQSVEPVEPPASLKAAILAEAQSDLRARRRSEQAAERLVASIGTQARRAVPTNEESRSEAEAAGAATSAGAMSEPKSAAPVGVPETRPAELPEPIALPARKAAEPAVVPFTAAGGPISVRRRPRRLRFLELIAAALAIVAIGGLGVRVVQLQNDLDLAHRQLQIAQGQIEKFFAPPAPDEVVVQMQPTASNGPTGRALLRSNGHLVLYMMKLPPTAGSQVYALWAVTTDARAQKLASFEVDDSGIAELQDVGPIQTGSIASYRVTLEADRDATAPSSNVVATGAPSR